MSRNGAGVYSLPSAFNPVAANTVILADWANTTLSDLATAMTDSLDRQGRGGMTAALKLFDGTVSVPGLSWTAETTTGLSRPAAGQLSVSVTATEVLRMTQTAIASQVALSSTSTITATTNFIGPGTGLTGTATALSIGGNAATATLAATATTAITATTATTATTAGNVTGIVAVANGGTGVSALGTGAVTFLVTPSSANLRALITDETGTGAAVFATSPTLVTPLLGTPTSGTLTNCTGLPLSTGVTGTLPVANGGTGQTSYTNGQLLIGNTTGNTLTKATLTAGTGISITNGTGTITIAATASGVLSNITAAAGANTIASGDNAQVWNWRITTNGKSAFTFGESTASTGTNAVILRASTQSSSTAIPFLVQAQGSDVLQVEAAGGLTVSTRATQAISLNTGGGSGVDGGSITIGTFGGGTGTGNGGSLSLTSGAGNSGGGNAGDISITAGNSGATSGSAGSVTITAGTRGNAGVGPNVLISAGAGSGAAGGDLQLSAGTGSSNGFVDFINTSVANGAVATTLGSVGPTGANTTVQQWLRIKVNGTTRYIPCW